MPGESNINIYNHNASPASNGWEFQYAAALCLLMRTLPESEKLSAEGKEDIDIRFTDDSVYYGQAKSALSSDDIQEKNMFSTVKESLKSLSDNDSSLNASRLYVVFNFRRPFANHDTHVFLEDIDEISFNELTTDAQNEIRNYCLNNNVLIDFDKLYFLYIPFEQGSNKIRAVKNEVCRKIPEKFLDRLSLIDSILDCCRRLIANNAASPSEFINKRTFEGVLMGYCLRSELNYEKLLQDLGLDDDDYYLSEIVKPALEDLISNESSNYGLYISMIHDFYSFCEKERLATSPRVSRKAFLNSLNENTIPTTIVESCIVHGIAEEYHLVLYKLFACYALLRKEVILEIKEKFENEN